MKTLAIAVGLVWWVIGNKLYHWFLLFMIVLMVLKLVVYLKYETEG